MQASQMNLLLIFSNISASVVRGSAVVGGGPESARERGGGASQSCACQQVSSMCRQAVL